MRIAGLVQDSIVDGPGLRNAMFVHGCKLRCEGCHNPDTWDADGGSEVPVDEIINEILSNPLTDGITLSGGEPFDQAADCVSLAAVAHDRGLNVWVFSGYTFEELLVKVQQEPAIYKLLSLTNVLIDGRFTKAQRSLSLKWCGSKNQRVLDVQKSLAAKKGVLYNDC